MPPRVARVTRGAQRSPCAAVAARAGASLAHARAATSAACAPRQCEARRPHRCHAVAWPCPVVAAAGAASAVTQVAAALGAAAALAAAALAAAPALWVVLDLAAAPAAGLESAVEAAAAPAAPAAGSCALGRGRRAPSAPRARRATLRADLAKADVCVCVCVSAARRGNSPAPPALRARCGAAPPRPTERDEQAHQKSIIFLLLQSAFS